MPDHDPRPYDAVLLVSFGGPEKPEDVVPFLQNVTKGRGVPAERLAEVGQHYFRFGGRSPINDQNRALLAAIRADFAAAGLDLPVFWGNRNWDPYLADAVREMATAGVTRAACFVTSAYSSYSGCRQYRHDLAGAVDAAAGTPVRLDKLRHYYNHPGFLGPVVDATLDGLARVGSDDRVESRVEVLFVTHSIPVSMNRASGPGGEAYTGQHRAAMAEVMRRVHAETGRRFGHELAYCSRSGPPSMPWLEPDVNDRIRELADRGVDRVVLVPIGFVSDHMEVIYDLDTEALATAAAVGTIAVRVATPGVDPRFVTMVRELVLERAAAERGESPLRVSWGDGEITPDTCAVGCCS